VRAPPGPAPAKQQLWGRLLPKTLFPRVGKYVFSSSSFPLCVPAALSFPIEIPWEEAALSGAEIKSILDEPVFAIPLLVNPGMFWHLDSACGVGRG